MGDREPAAPLAVMTACAYLRSRKLLQIVGGAGDCPGQAQLGHIVGEDAVDRVQFGRGERLLGLDHFDIVGDSGFEALPGQVERLLGDLQIALCQLDLVGRGAQIEEGIAHLALHLAFQVFEFGLALGQRCLRLLDVAFGADLPARREYSAWRRH